MANFDFIIILAIADNWDATVGPSEVTYQRTPDGKYVCVADMGLSDKDLQDITDEWQKTVLVVQQSLIAKKKFVRVAHGLIAEYTWFIITIFHVFTRHGNCSIADYAPVLPTVVDVEPHLRWLQTNRNTILHQLARCASTVGQTRRSKNKH
eukprot:SAG31_NODE_4852_length_2905_cov_3.033143_3_plen_151_part_00